MTDIGSWESIPGSLGTSAWMEGDRFCMDVVPSAHVLQHGVLRTSVLSFLVDAVAGVAVDRDADAWMLTTDMSVRATPRPAVEGRTIGVATLLRQGGRSTTSVVDLVTEDGTLVGAGAIGFARVPRRETDPPKLPFTLEDLASRMGTRRHVDQPLRDAAGIEVVDAAEGIVEVEVLPKLLNPAGTLQGAMVALIAESAAEELVQTRFGVDAVVSELDLRYLAKTGAGPVRTTSRLLGDRPDSPVEVLLTDTSTGQVTTHVYARATTFA